jgi:Tfp pilus assembly protein PilO
MGPFEMVVLIVALAMAGSAWKHYLDSKKVNDAANADLRAQVRALEARVVTLEAIATDPAKRLSDEIGKLS